MLALRAENGTPILKTYVVPATETEPASTEYCVQPVSYEPVPGLTVSVNPVDGRSVSVIPLQGEWLGDPNSPIAQDEIGACDPQTQYAMFVKETELERLNLARTSEDVIAQKLADVKTKLTFADQIALESTGRITWDGTPIDASPENAAIYQSLMTTGTIPGLHPASMAGPPAQIGPFDAWHLAAMSIGAAASKSVPLTIDAVEYYNRVIGFPPPADPTATPPVPDYESPWGVSFVRSSDPANPGTELGGSERFVDYSNFRYNRSETFKGSVTWLDVPTLTWKVSKITDVVPFTNLSSEDEIGDKTLTGVTAFAQLADDVRALCNFIPDNTFIPGFYMDVPGADTTDAQLKAIHDPAVDLGTLPENVFKTQSFPVTASLLNPWGGAQIDGARLRLTVDAPDNLADGDVTATAPDGQTVPFTPDGNGNLVGWWGPESGFPVQPGYNVSTRFDVTVGGTAPSGNYALTLDLVNVNDAPLTPLASESGTIKVNDNAATVLWAGSVVKYVTQGTAVKLPVQVYAPAAGTAHLTLTVTGPGDDPLTTDVVEALAAGDVKVYGSNGTTMVPMALTLNADGQLVGTWAATLGAEAGYTPVTWYATVGEGAPVGNYAFGVNLEGGNTLDPAVVAISAPEQHGEQPPDAGEDTTAPVVTATPATTPGTDASFTLAANEDGVTFECQLTKDGTVDQAWASCTSPKTYTGLDPGSYVFSARGTDRVGLVSEVATWEWVVGGPPPADTTAPVITIDASVITTTAATFTFSADEPVTSFQCQLTKNNRAEGWEPCTSATTMEYTGLKPSTYFFSVRGTDLAGNASDVVNSAAWTVSHKGGKPSKAATPPQATTPPGRR